MITLEPGCRGSIQNHIFSPQVHYETKANVKQVDMKFNLKELLDIEKEDEIYLEELLIEEMAIGQKPAPITDVMKKYHLNIIKKHHHWSFGVIGTTIAIIIFILSFVICLLINIFKRRN